MDTARKRVRQEFEELQYNSPQGCSVTLVNNNDIFRWQVAVLGPDNSPYEGSLFFLSFIFPYNFPYQPPITKFITPIYHLNVSKEGHFYLPCLHAQNWTPVLSMYEVIVEISRLLAFPDAGPHPMNEDAADLFHGERTRYDAKAREYTSEYAIRPRY